MIGLRVDKQDSSLPLCICGHLNERRLLHAQIGCYQMKQLFNLIFTFLVTISQPLKSDLCRDYHITKAIYFNT